MAIEDLRPLFTERMAAKVHPAQTLRPVAEKPRLILDADARGLLRDGLGYFDMEIRWMVHLDEAGVLRMWRSWTGFQIYEARVAADGSLSDLRVEQHPDSYTGLLCREPELFEQVLSASIDQLRQFRAGHTPYGPSESAGPLPEPWCSAQT